MYVYGWFACVYVWYLGRPEEGAGSPKILVKHGCEPSYGSWGLNLGCLEEQSLL